MNRIYTAILMLAVFAMPGLAQAQGKIAVVDLQAAILQTDMAQQRIAAVRAQEDYKSDKAEFDRLKTEFDDLVKQLQNDMAVML